MLKFTQKTITSLLPINRQQIIKKLLPVLSHINSKSFGEVKKIYPPIESTTFLSKIKQQFQEADKYLRKKNNLDEAIKKYQAVLHSFNYNNQLNTSYGIKALIGVAEALILQKKSDKALDYFLLALAFHPTYKTESDRAELCQRIGECYYDVQDFGKSLHYFQKSLHLYKKSSTGDNYVIGSINVYLGRIYTEANDLYQAIDYYKNGIEMIESSNKNPYVVLKAKTELAKIYALAKETLTSWSGLYEAMMQLDQSVQFTTTERITVTDNICQVLEILGFYRELLERYQVLIDLLKEEGLNKPMKKIVELFNNKAIVHTKLEEYNEAIDDYMKTLNESERLDDSSFAETKSKVLCQVGLCHWSRGNFEDARSYLHTAAEYYENGDQDAPSAELGNIYYFIGRVFYSEEYYEQSLMAFRKGLKILQMHHEETNSEVMEVQDYIDKVKEKLRDYDDS